MRILIDGNIQKGEEDQSVSLVNFKKTSISLSGISTKTISEPKIQETSTFRIVNCLLKNSIYIHNCDDSEKFYKDIISISLEIYSNDLTIIPGAYEYIEKSKRNLFIGSNSIKLRILKGLKKVQLDKFFNKSKIFSFDMVKNPKPYPDIYIKVIESNQLEKKETVIIEDSPVGVQAGIAAGINVIGITAGSHWTQNRSDKQLIDSGAIHVISNFKFKIQVRSNSYKINQLFKKQN